MKFVSIVGARPQFIKASVVSRALRAMKGVEEILVHTGQHYDQNMSDLFFQEMGIPKPGYHLGIGSGSHGAQTGKMLASIEQVLMDELPNALIVYGDTNSTLAGGLAAAKLHIPVAHIEAGLRSFNRRMPEEINRVVVDHLSERLYVPTDAGRKNLDREGIAADKILVCGDVMYDASLHYLESAKQQSTILARLNIQPGQFMLATVHRAENTDDLQKLSNICEALGAIKSHEVIFPVHPRTRSLLNGNTSLREKLGSVRIIEPVGYLDMVMLEKHAALVVTDSGGVQKEAFFFGVPCVTLRDETEWVELVELGWNILSPPVSAAGIAESIALALKHKPQTQSKPYGNGAAAVVIANDLISAF